MKDSDLGRLSSEHLLGLGAPARPAWIWLPEHAGKGKEAGPGQVAKGPSAPRSPDKASPRERRSSRAVEDETQLEPRHTCGRLVRAGHPPPPPPTRRHGPAQPPGHWKAARGRKPRGPGSPPAAAPTRCGPRGLQPLAGLSFAGRTVGPRETKEPPPPLRPPPLRSPRRVPLPSRRARLALTPPRVRAPAARGP